MALQIAFEVRSGKIVMDVCWLLQLRERVPEFSGTWVSDKRSLVRSDVDFREKVNSVPVGKQFDYLFVKWGHP